MCLADATRARVHYIAAQYVSPWASLINNWPPAEKDTINDVAFHLETALSLYLTAGDDTNALLTFTELRNYRIYAAAPDPTLSDIAQLYRDCVSMRSATLPPVARAWVQALENLYARTLSLSNATIQESLRDALSLITEHGSREMFTYPMMELRGILLLGSQTGAITESIRGELTAAAAHPMGFIWSVAFGRVRPGGFGDTGLNSFALLIQRDWGIAPTRFRTEEFWTLLQTHLGLTPNEAKDVFARHDLARFDESPRLPPTVEVVDARKEFEAAATKLLATPRNISFDSGLQHMLADLNVIADDLVDIQRHREMFRQKDLG